MQASVVPPVQPPSLPTVSFSSPEAGKVVSPEFVVRGMVRAIPEKQQLWLVTRREAGGDFWPKQRVVPNSDGSFEKRIGDGGQSGELWVCLLSIDGIGAKRLADWGTEAERTGTWSPIKLEDTSGTIVGCEGLTLRNPASARGG